ncbi:MAG: efflux RND transporter periplasmic adaptor subunit [Bradyrhizobium sp.]
MTLSEYLKPAMGVVFLAALAGSYYWFENRPQPMKNDIPTLPVVVVTKSSHACFADRVRVTGHVVPRREAMVVADQEGSRVTALFVRTGDMVSYNQELARLSAPPGKSGQISLRAPASGLVTEVRTAVGAPASPQAGPMFRISIKNQIELDAEVPASHLLKLNPGATARIEWDHAPDQIGRVRLIPPQVNRTTQLGHVRISLTNDPAVKIGMFARATIDSRRSCGVAVPRTAMDHLTVQVVKGNTIETRKVRVGLVSDADVEILEGLDVGETVVAAAGSSLHDGDQVKTMFADELDRQAR